MRIFITSKNKYLLNDMKIFGTCSIPLKTKSNEIIMHVQLCWCYFSSFGEQSILWGDVYVRDRVTADG